MKRLRQFGLGVALTLFASVALLLVVPAAVPGTWWGPWLARRLSGLIEADVELRSAQLWPLHGVALEGLVVGPPPGFSQDVLRVERAELSYRPLSLLTGRAVVRSLVLERTRARIETDPEGRLNVSALFSSTPDDPVDPEPGPPFRWPLPIEVERLDLRDLGIELRTAELDLASGPLSLTVQARGEDHRLEARARLGWRPGASGETGGVPWAGTGDATATATASVDFSRPWTDWALDAGWEHEVLVAIGEERFETAGELKASLRPEADQAELRIRRLAWGARTEVKADLGISGLSALANLRTGGTAAVDAALTGRVDLAELPRWPGVRVSGVLHLDRVRAGVRWVDGELVPGDAAGRVRAVGAELDVFGTRGRVDQAELSLDAAPREVRARLDGEGVAVDRGDLAVREGEAQVSLAVARTGRGSRATWTATVASARVGWSGGSLRGLRSAARGDVGGLRLDGTFREGSSGLRASARRVEASGAVVEGPTLVVRGAVAEGGEDARVDARVTAGEVRGFSVRGRGPQLTGRARVVGGRWIEAELGLFARRLVHPVVTVEQLEAQVSARAKPGASWSAAGFEVPHRARWSASARAAPLSLAVDEERWVTPVELDVEADLDPFERSFRAARAVVRLSEETVARVLADGALDGPARVEVGVEAPSLGPLTAALPGAWWPRPGALEGGLEADGRAELAPGWSRGGLGGVQGSAAVRLRDVSLEGETLVLDRARGTLRGHYLGPGEMGAGWRLTADRVAGPGETEQITGLATTGTLAVDRRGARLRAALDGTGGRSSAVAVDLAGARARVDVAHDRGLGLRVRRARVDLPAAGIAAAVRGRVRSGRYGVWQPELAASATVAAGRARALWPGLRAGEGEVSARASLSAQGDRRWRLAGRVSAREVAVETDGFAVSSLNGRVPFDQALVVEPPRFSPAVARARGVLGDDFEARAEELVGRLRSARIELDPRDILVDAPVRADYEALRPYVEAPGARATASWLRIGGTPLEDVVFEADYASGLLLIRRLAFGIWQGDVLLDAALQVTPDRDVRLRTRGTGTRLNLDIPYASVEGRSPRLDPEGDGPYTTSGVLDLRFALRERQLNGTVDLERVTKPQLERAFGALELESAKSALKWLELSERFGVRPTEGKIWINNNLLSAEFDWERLWLHVSYQSPAPWDLVVDTFFIVGRLATVPTVGASIINIVNSAVRRFSIGNLIDRAVVTSGLVELLVGLDDVVAPAVDPSSGGGGALTAPRVAPPRRTSPPDPKTSGRARPR